MTATPWGFRDILPEEAQVREEIAQTVKGCFKGHHYLPVETPILEDKAGLEEGGRCSTTTGACSWCVPTIRCLSCAWSRTA